MVHYLTMTLCIIAQKKYKLPLFHFCIDISKSKTTSALLHQLFYEMKAVQTKLFNNQDSETASSHVLNQWP